MSLSPSAREPAAVDAWRWFTARRVAIVLVAIAVLAAILSLLAWGLGQAMTPAPPPKNPFGTGLREAAPSGSLGAMLVGFQSQFYRSLTAGVEAFARSGTGFWALLGVGFAYGVFHAAGPGHGKAVISGYLLANERTLIKGVIVSFAAAALQAFVAIALVGVLTVALKATAASINATANTVELVSFALVAVVGALMLWRKAGKLAYLTTSNASSLAAAGCDHAHMPTADVVAEADTFRDWLAVVVAAGSRPCSGAIILLVFAIAQGAIAAGIAATLAMALGTAITTCLVAALAVFAKGLALKFAGGRGRSGTLAVAGVEVLASAFVFVLGLTLLAGLAAAGAS